MDRSVNTLFGPCVGRSGLCLHQLFERQVSRTPDSIAVEHREAKVTYGELNGQANRMAHYLSKHGVSPQDFVLIAATPSLDCIALLLAVFKCGAAYVPVDPALSHARVAEILDQIPIGTVITSRDLSPHFEGQKRRVISIQDLSGLSASCPSSNLDLSDLWDQLAYVMFTSGSTGRPKGVLVHHGGIANLVESMVEAWPIRRDSRVLQFASLGFDASVPEWAGPLIVGGTVVLKPRAGIMLGLELVEFLDQSRISVLKLPAAALRALPASRLASLRTIVTAGDACTRELVDQWAPGRRFFNCYGPTEVSIGTCMAELRAGESGPISIGVPNPNLHVMVLDDDLEPTESGRVGELYVGGLGLAWGYASQPGLTADRFLPNKSSHPGARMYRTGDKVRVLGDGSLQFLGRVDEQVKVRGFRVELGEIEVALLANPEIEQAAVKVIAQGGSEPVLTAFLVTVEGTLTADRLETFLSTKIPSYMIPQRFRRLPALPLTINGKVDKRGLNGSSGQELSHSDNSEAELGPEGDEEHSLAAIWGDVLGREVPVNRSFTQLGGDSLCAAKVSSQMNQLLGIRVSVASILKCSGIRDLLRIRALPATQDLTSLSEEELDKLLNELRLCSDVANV